MFAKYCSLLFLFAGQVFAGPEIQHWQTTNGVRVYFVEAHELPMLDINVTFDSGSARDPKHRKGLAAMTSSLLADGAAGLDADQISYAFERLGAGYGSNVSYDSASLSLRSLADKSKLKNALGTLLKVMSQPDFPEQAVERQRKRFLTGIQQKQQSPGTVARETFYAELYGSHPYAYPQSGTETSVKSISRQDIVDFHRRYYVAANAIIAIVGDLRRPDAEAVAEELSAALRKGKRAKAIPAVAGLASAKTISTSHPSTQTHVLLGQVGMKRGDPDYFPLYVGNHILGGSGLVSLLFREIREKRALSYSAYSYFSPMREYGPFVAGLSTRADQADEALQLLRQNIEVFVKQGPSEEDLLAAKKNISGGFPLRIDSNSNILAYIGMIGFYNLPLDYLETFTGRIEAVSVEDIREAMARRIQPDRLIAVMVGPDSQESREAN